MKNLTIILVLVFAFGFGGSIFSQRDLEKGEEAFKNGEFSIAKDFLKDALTKIKDKEKKAEITFRIAECYRYLLNPKLAESWYDKAIKKGYPDPLAVLYLADAMKMNEKYDEAVIEYKKYMKQIPDDPRGEFGENSCELASGWKKNPTRYQVENMAFFNSKEEDFSPTFAKKDFKIVYFTTSREGAKGDKKSAISGQNFTDIFQTSLDRKGKWSVPTPLGEPVNSDNDEGASTLNQKGNTMYFTRCPVEKGKILGCHLYSAAKKGNNWDIPVQITIPGIADSVTIQYPCISIDEKTLYFTANLPGGYGGMDIWSVAKSKKGKGDFLEPVNLGHDVNTSGNEAFPFIREGGTLYFASDGQLGMGGLDMFKAKKDADGKWKAENLQYPLNTSSDDFGIIFEGNADRGFFTSNRTGGKGASDIYYFEIPGLQLTVEGFIKDEATGASIVGALVKILGDDGYSLEMNSEADGSFKFKLRENVDYSVSATYKDYYTNKVIVSSKGINQNKLFKQDILLSKIEIKKAIVLPNIEYNFNDSSLRPESTVSLDKLIETLIDNPNITIELGAHTDFRGKDEYNMKLSLGRARSVVNYLISKGIEADRLSWKGYGESQPKLVTDSIAKHYPFLKTGDVLDEKYITALKGEKQKDDCHQINRRTEFKVLSTDYIPKVKPQNDDEQQDQQDQPGQGTEKPKEGGDK